VVEVEQLLQFLLLYFQVMMDHLQFLVQLHQQVVEEGEQLQILQVNQKKQEQEVLVVEHMVILHLELEEQEIHLQQVQLKDLEVVMLKILQVMQIQVVVAELQLKEKIKLLHMDQLVEQVETEEQEQLLQLQVHQ
jgi:hypothetical protein